MGRQITRISVTEGWLFLPKNPKVARPTFLWLFRKMCGYFQAFYSGHCASAWYKTTSVAWFCCEGSGQ